MVPGLEALAGDGGAGAPPPPPDGGAPVPPPAGGAAPPPPRRAVASNGWEKILYRARAVENGVPNTEVEARYRRLKGLVKVEPEKFMQGQIGERRDGAGAGRTKDEEISPSDRSSR